MKHDASQRVHEKGLFEKIRANTGWSFRNPPDLPTDHKYEILQYADGDYAFRVFNKKREGRGGKLKYVEFWIHPVPDEENLWELYPRAKWAKRGRPWESCEKSTLIWDPEKDCFTKGVSKLHEEELDVIETFNLLVRKSKHGFEQGDNARIINGESPFEEEYV